MFIDIRVLQQQKNQAKQAMTEMLNAADAVGRQFNASEQQRFDDLKMTVKQLDRQITDRATEIETERNTAGRAYDTRGGLSGAARGNGDEFKDHRDFLGAVMGFSLQGQMDQRLSGYRATQGSDEQSVTNDPYGGFLVPRSVAPDIMSVSAEDDPLAGLVTAVPMAVSSLSINARVDKNHTNSVSGGLTVTRRPELVDGASSRMEFEQVTLNARELFGFTFASESIIHDSPMSFIALLGAGFKDEFANKLMAERLSGSGNGQFLGVLNSQCVIQVPKEIGQAAATIVTENIDKMAARCWRYGKAVWLANHNTRPQLRGLVRAVGTGGSVVPYFQTVNGQETLDGRPIFFTEHCPALGTAGDLLLGNWSEYLEGTCQPMQQAESIHVRFIANERAFKFWLRNAGQPWWKSALTPKHGDTLSPFITLAGRS